MSSVMTNDNPNSGISRQEGISAGAAFLFPVPPLAALNLRPVEEDQPRRNHHETATA